MNKRLWWGGRFPNRTKAFAPIVGVNRVGSVLQKALPRTSWQQKGEYLGKAAGLIRG